MAKRVRVEIDYDKVVEIFNTNGKNAAVEYVENTYNVSYGLVQRRIRTKTNYQYNRSINKYKKALPDEETFLSIEELCDKKPASDSYEAISENKFIAKDDNDFEKIVLSMMKDRLLELDKFIFLEQSRKRLLINMKGLELNGYQVILS